MYKDCLGIMKEQCKNSRLPHLLMIVVHGEILWLPAPQLMDDDDDDEQTPVFCWQSKMVRRHSDGKKKYRWRCSTVCSSEV